MARPARRPRPVAMATPRRSARLAAQRTTTPPAAAPPRRENQAMVTKYVALHLVVLVDAGPGTGKSSQIPRLLHAAGHGCVVCSQMYRLAALGRQVGYSVPLDDRSSDADTVVKYITHGALLRELAADPLLTRYGAVVVDDAHDGMAITGVVLSCVKAAAARRLDLRVVVCLNHYSTLCKGVVHGFSSPAPTTSARPSTRCAASTRRSRRATCWSSSRAARTSRQPSTHSTGCALLGLATCCLHDGLPMHRIHDVFRPAADGRRKVVLATDVAVCSVFVDGIKYIVDSGYCGTDNAPVHLIGGGAPGSRPESDGADGDVLLPVYTREEEKGFPYVWNPANKMADVNALVGVILTLKALGSSAPELIHWAVRTLKAAGVLSQDGEVTETGRRIAREISGRYY
ncbi:hypothetical protein DAI22_11g062600 [Oryza sativa Japonica Group]|nr:hypothetical protein DAI22_11g062600 [Oryza sativa Japonica Group]